MKTIIRVWKDEKENFFEVSDKPKLIGREDYCEIKIKDPIVSSKHAEIFLKNNQIIVKDLQSKNGIFINNTRYVGEKALYRGDILKIGSYFFTIDKNKNDTDVLTKLTFIGSTLSNIKDALKLKLESSNIRKKPLTHRSGDAKLRYEKRFQPSVRKGLSNSQKDIQARDTMKRNAKAIDLFCYLIAFLLCYFEVKYFPLLWAVIISLLASVAVFILNCLGEFTIGEKISGISKTYRD